MSASHTFVDDPNFILIGSGIMSATLAVMLKKSSTCLPQLLANAEGQERMRQMIPTFDHDLKQPGSAALFGKTTREAAERLQLHPQP